MTFRRSIDVKRLLEVQTIFTSGDAPTYGDLNDGKPLALGLR